MIIPNLLVKDLHASASFYTDALGFEVLMVLGTDQTMHDDPAAQNACFVTLAWNGFQLMLQTRQHLEASQLASSVADAICEPTLTGSLYLRDYPWDQIIDRLPESAIVREPVQQWYGMYEIAVADPDGYIWVLGRQQGPPPQ